MHSRMRTRCLRPMISKTFHRARITPQLAEYGITLLGNYRGLPLYASESQYTDVDGTSKYFVPADKVLVAASGLQGTLAYAGIVQVDEDGNGMQPYEATTASLGLL